MSTGLSLLLTSVLSTPLMVLQMSVLQLIAGEAQGLPTYRSYIYMKISGEDQFIHTYSSQIVDLRGGTVYTYMVINSSSQKRKSLYIHTGHK